MFKETNIAQLNSVVERIAEKQPGLHVFTEYVIEKAYAMYDYLKICSENTNLVGDLTEENYVLRHFLDSIAFLSDYKVHEGARIADLGSGAGFPGIPLAVVRRDLRIYSVEATGKKADFQSNLINTNNIGNCEVINDRIEAFGRSEQRETMDFVASRALDRLSVLCEYALPLLKIGGKTLFFKSDNIDKEISELDAPLEELGGSLDEVLLYRVGPDQPQRRIVIIKKDKQTPEKYPRRTGVPHKRPLI